MKLIKKIYKFFDKKIIVPITKFFVNIGDKLKNIGKPLEIVSKSKKGMGAMFKKVAKILFTIFKYPCIIAFLMI